MLLGSRYLCITAKEDALGKISQSLVIPLPRTLKLYLSSSHIFLRGLQKPVGSSMFDKFSNGGAPSNTAGTSKAVYEGRYMLLF